MSPAMRRAVLALSMLTFAAAPPAGQSGEAGSIAGTGRGKTVGGPAMPSTVYPTRAIGPRTTHPIATIKIVVVYLKDVTYRGALPARRAQLRQENETFVPHVAAVTRGSTVEFPNDDPIYHNVFSL